MDIAKWLRTGLICGILLIVLSVVMSGNLYSGLLLFVVSVISSYFLYKYKFKKLKQIILNFGLIFIFLGIPTIGFVSESQQIFYKHFQVLTIFIILGGILFWSILLTLFQYYYFKRDMATATAL